MSRLRRWIHRGLRAHRRFQYTFGTARAAIEARTKSLPVPDPSWPARVEGLLARAQEQADAGDLDGAWHFLHEATSGEIACLRGQELWNREQILECEVEKIPSKWRQCAIRKLLQGDPAKQGEEDRARRLQDATGVLMDQFETQYHRSGLLRDHMRNLLLIGLLALGAFLALVASAATPLSEWPDWDWKTLLAVLLFGVLGASFSATRQVSGESSSLKIPEITSQLTVTWARTILGAVPALALYALARAGLVRIAEPDTVKFLALAFAAGFSERLVLKVLESGDTSQATK